MPDIKGFKTILLSIAGVIIVLGATAFGTVLIMVHSADVEKIDRHISVADRHFLKFADDFRRDTEAINNGTVWITVIDSEITRMKNQLTTMQHSQSRIQDDVQQIVIEITKISSHIESEH